MIRKSALVGSTQPRKAIRMVAALNEQGKRIGETHHNSEISYAIVDRIRERHEEDGLGYVALAEEFNLSKNTIRKICTYERRAQTPAPHVTITMVANG